MSNIKTINEWLQDLDRGILEGPFELVRAMQKEIVMRDERIAKLEALLEDFADMHEEKK